MKNKPKPKKKPCSNKPAHYSSKNRTRARKMRAQDLTQGALSKFRRQANCQRCSENKASHFGEFITTDDGQIHHLYTCECCSALAIRPAIRIDDFFRTPAATVAILGHMNENNTNWKSFGEMIGSFRQASGTLHHIPF